MSGLIHVEILEAPLDVFRACEIVADPAHGAIDTFIGVVRNRHEGQNVTGITYDVHKTLAEKVFHEICGESSARWPGTKYYVAHYHGALAVGGISILIAVSAAHRAETFDACRYVIEEIKKRAPIWKQEHYPDGRSEWLPGHSLASGAGIEAETVCCGKCHASG